MIETWYIMYLVLTLGSHEVVLMPYRIYPDKEACLTEKPFWEKKTRTPISCQPNVDLFFPKGVYDIER